MIERLKQALAAGKRVAVLMGGSSPEREVSLKSGAALLAALERRGWNPIAIDPADGRALAATLLENRVAVAVLALHGAGGEDGTIQGMLEILGIPYTGSFVGASALCMNKLLSKRLFRDAGIPTPPWEELRFPGDNPEAGMAQLTLPLPCFVKPMSTGSSVGISRAQDSDSLRAGLLLAAQADGTDEVRVLVEQEIRGTEVTLAVFDDTPLPLIEIRPGPGFYDYQAKYASGGTTRYLIPPEGLSEQAMARATEAGVAAGQVTGCRGLYRVDMIIDAEQTPWVLEINTLPGMTATSLAPKAAGAIGWSFDDLAERILVSAGLETCPADF
ncbi:MAG: D-alanine--D-alanine ligase [Magnetococcales bacterium]|nr:D-alanine--D-alanine ligase [Magnetococcales bacterium]